MQTWKKVAFRAMAAGALLALTPLAFSPASGIEENAACAKTATGVCAREMNSVCSDGRTVLWDHYHRIDW
jgi:hypothetical protein